MRYGFIRDHSEEFHVENACRVLKVSVSGCQSALKIDPLSASNIDPPNGLFLHRVSSFNSPAVVACFYDFAVVSDSVE